MERASRRVNNRKRKARRPSGQRKAASFFLLFVCIIAALACVKLLTDKVHGENPLGQSSVNNTVIQAANTSKAQEKKDDAWNLILVNRENPVPADYKVELKELSNGQQVDTRIYSALMSMLDAAKDAGIYTVVASGYRTQQYQQGLMDDKIKEYKTQGYGATQAQKLAEQWVAPPGTSEHQIGIAVDINADKEKSKSDDVYAWLHKNSYKYGFILRYPSNKTEITGTIYEPWHFRYVGIEAATEIYNNDLCLEEYMKNKKN